MSQSPPRPDGDDPLEQAIQALQRSTSQVQPTADSLERAIGALRDLGVVPRVDKDSTPLRRRRKMFVVFKLVGAAAACAALAWVGLFEPAGPTVAFGQVIDQFQKAHTFSYRQTIQVPGTPAPVVMLQSFRDPGQLRSCTDQADGPITIIDMTQARGIILEPKSHTALVLGGDALKGNGDPSQHLSQGFVETMRTLAKKDGKPQGKKRIGDIEAQGFQVEESGQTLTVWADPATGTPLEMETITKLNGVEIHSVLDRFVIDPDLDPALFSTAVPEGYKVQDTTVVVGTPEEAVVGLLRTYADACAGSFPPRIDDSLVFANLGGLLKVEGPTDPKLHQLVQSMTQTSLFLREIGPENFSYTSYGVKLGEGAKTLFLYRLAPGGPVRVLRGDLTWADGKPNDLPIATPAKKP